MRFFQIVGDDEDDPDGNVQHVGQHGLTVDDVEYDIENPTGEDVSRSSGEPCFFGYTPAGDSITVIYELIDEDTIYPLTPYEVPEP